MPLPLIIDVNDPQQDGLLASFDSEGQPAAQQLVRGDKNLLLTVRPVVASGNPANLAPWIDDYQNGDTFTVGVGYKDRAPTGGTFSFMQGATAKGPFPYNVTESALQSALASPEAASVKLLAEGVYEITKAVNGNFTNAFTPSPNSLTPSSSVTFLTDTFGSSVNPQVVILVLKQSPVALAFPSEILPAATLQVAIKRNGSASSNKVYQITFPIPGTYGGTYSVKYTAISGAVGSGVLTPKSTPEDVVAILGAVTNPDDFSVQLIQNGYTVELRGSQKNSDAPTLQATDIDLVAPKGAKGRIDFNTPAMYRAFYAAGTAETLEMTLEVRRARVDDEEKTILQKPITLKRSLLDVGSLTPAVVPDFYPRYQSVSLINGQDYIDVTFTTPFNDANWHLSGAPYITTTDGSFVAISVQTIVSKTATGFRAYLSGAPDSANYLMSFTCAHD